MTKIIIHPNQYGTITITEPILECGLTVEEIANKDVPAGVPYLIIDKSEVPTDKSFRDAWIADFSNPDGYAMGSDEWYKLHPQ